MSARFSVIPTDAVEDPSLTLLDLRVLCLLGSFVGRKGEAAFPRQATIAASLGCARESVNRSIRRLAGAGYLMSKAQYDEKGSQIASLYWVRTEPKFDEVQPPSGRRSNTTSSPCDPSVTPPRCDVQITPGVTSEVIPGVTYQVTQRKKPNLTIPIEESNLSDSRCEPDTGPPQDLGIDPAPQPAPEPVEPKSAEKGMVVDDRPVAPSPAPKAARPDLQDAFADLWSIWPQQGRNRSKSRPLCMAALGRAAKDRQPREIVAAARNWLKTLSDPKFCPALDRWLANGKWEHFLPSADLFAAPADRAKAEADAAMRKLRQQFQFLIENGYWKAAWGDDPRVFSEDYPIELYAEFGIPLPNHDQLFSRQRNLAQGA